jgi:hypothetical protein
MAIRTRAFIDFLVEQLQPPAAGPGRRAGSA